MTLEQKLKELNPKELVFIGANSAFFFIGTPKDFEEQRDGLNADWTDKFAKSLRNAENLLETHKASKPKKTDVPTTKKVWNNIDNQIKVERAVVEYAEKLKDWEKKKEVLERSVATRYETLYNFTDFGSRQVINCYRNMNNDANIVIVEGEEASRFWFYEEYLRYLNGEKVIIDSSADEDELEEDEFDEGGDEIIGE